MIYIVDVVGLIGFIVYIIAIGILYFGPDFIDWISDIKWKRKYNKNTEKNKDITIKIIDEFEKLLAKHDIKIPNEERENNEYEAAIYGKNYYDLEDSIIQILNYHIKKVR